MRLWSRRRDEWLFRLYAEGFVHSGGGSGLRLRGGNRDRLGHDRGGLRCSRSNVDIGRLSGRSDITPCGFEIATRDDLQQVLVGEDASDIGMLFAEFLDLLLALFGAERVLIAHGAHEARFGLRRRAG